MLVLAFKKDLLLKIHIFHNYEIDATLVAKQYWEDIGKSLANIIEIFLFTLGCLHFIL